MLYLCSMEIFYANEINGGLALLDADESAHCVRVLRHRVGDEVTVVDGIGNMYAGHIAAHPHQLWPQLRYFHKL